MTINRVAVRFFYAPVIWLAATLSLTGCFDDGVPKVDDVNNIVVNGEQMTPRQFLDKFCVQHKSNETCGAVARQARVEALDRKPSVRF